MPGALFVDPATLDPRRVVLNRDQIHAILPHRDQMSFIDSVILHDAERKVMAGTMHVPKAAFWTSGHFPGNPILPGIVMIEAAAQISLIYFKTGVPEIRNKLVLFGGVEEVRFRGTVKPGDLVLVATREISMTPRGGKNETQAYLNGKLIYEGTIFAIAT